MSETNARLFNLGLRSAGLAAKLALSLYMGRYFGLADIGIYGLVFAAVMTLNGVTGLHTDYIASRELTGLPPAAALHKMRDQAVFYFINYACLGLIALVIAGMGFDKVNGRILFYIVALTVAESFGNMTGNNMNAMERQNISNFLFFIRSGLWVFPVLALGALRPQWRSVDMVIAAWLVGACASIAVTFWFWRDLPWSAVFKQSVDWGWIGDAIRKSFPLWLGVMGLVIGGYIDRFIVGHFLDLDKVGIMTFYLSFANALLALIQNGVLSFSSPRLVTFYRSGDEPRFSLETRQMAKQAALFSSFLAIGICAAVHLIAVLLNRPAFIEAEKVLWLMMVAAWIRANAETLYTILFARHQDRAISMGNLLFLAVSLGGNAFLVPAIGLVGAGCSAILSALFLFFWRWRAVKMFQSGRY